MADLTPEKYWPLGSTVQKKITDLSDNDHYRHFGLISVNPINGHTVLIYRKGEVHVSPPIDYGVIKIRHSSDGGTTWSDEEVENVYSEANHDLRTAGGGYDSNGRLFVFFSTYDPNSPPYWELMKYIYSDNDGALDSWQGPYELDHQLDGETNTRFNPYGHIVDVGNNTLYQTWFGGVSGNPLSLYRIYLYKSTDGGLTFPTIISVTPDPPNPDQRRPWGEPSLVNVGGGCFLLLAKKNDDFNRFIQYKSENNCVTWIEQGTANFGESQLGDYAAPPFLSFINYEGVGIVACYYTNRGTKELKVIFGLAKDLLEGPGGWNNSTIKLVLDYETVEPPYCADRCGYQSFFLPLNQYKGIGVTFFEKYDDVAYPIIVFTNVLGMKDILVALGL